MIEFKGEFVDRVLSFARTEPPPDLTYRGEPLEPPGPSVLVAFKGGPRDGDVSVMPAGCDEWVEPDGTVYS